MTKFEILESGSSQHIEKIRTDTGNVRVDRGGHFRCTNCGKRKPCPPHRHPHELSAFSAALKEFRWSHKQCDATNIK